MLLSYLFLIHSSLLFYSDPSLQWKLLALVTVLVLTAGVVLTGDGIMWTSGPVTPGKQQANMRAGWKCHGKPAFSVRMTACGTA